VRFQPTTFSLRVEFRLDGAAQQFRRQPFALDARALAHERLRTLARAAGVDLDAT